MLYVFSNLRVKNAPNQYRNTRQVLMVSINNSRLQFQGFIKEIIFQTAPLMF